MAKEMPIKVSLAAALGFLDSDVVQHGAAYAEEVDTIGIIPLFPAPRVGRHKRSKKSV